MRALAPGYCAETFHVTPPQRTFSTAALGEWTAPSKGQGSSLRTAPVSFKHADEAAMELFCEESCVSTQCRPAPLLARPSPEGCCALEDPLVTKPSLPFFVDVCRCILLQLPRATCSASSASKQGCVAIPCFTSDPPSLLCQLTGLALFCASLAGSWACRLLCSLGSRYAIVVCVAAVETGWRRLQDDWSVWEGSQHGCAAGLAGPHHQGYAWS